MELVKWDPAVCDCLGIAKDHDRSISRLDPGSDCAYCGEMLDRTGAIRADIYHRSGPFGQDPAVQRHSWRQGANFLPSPTYSRPKPFYLALIKLAGIKKNGPYKYSQSLKKKTKHLRQGFTTLSRLSNSVRSRIW